MRKPSQSWSRLRKLLKATSILCLAAAFLISARPAQAQADIKVRGRHILLPQSPANASPSAQSGAHGDTEPVPIPGGDVIPPLIHIFAPGPTALGFDGIDVEPNGITNFRGFVAQGYLAGTATDSNGKTYNLFTDMRVFQGEYVSVDGTHHRGTFVFIWIDLFDPSSGSQVHDFNAGVRHSGLFWIAQVPDSALVVSGGTARLHLQEVPVVDNTFFLGPGDLFATASFDITWTPMGQVQHFLPGSSVPTDPSNFAAEIRFATATGSFSVFEEAISFTASGASSEGIFAEMGTERNGSFLQQ